MASYAQPSDLAVIAPELTTDQATWLLSQAAGVIDAYVWPGRRDPTLLAASGLALDLWTGQDRIRPHGQKNLYLGLPTVSVSQVISEGEGANGPPYPALPSTAWLFHNERNVLERVDGVYWPGGTGATIYYPLGGSASLSPMGVLVPGAYACTLVTRTRGFATFPPELVAINVAVALRLRLVTGIASEKLGDYQYTVRATDPSQLLPSEMDVLFQWSKEGGEVHGH